MTFQAMIDVPPQESAPRPNSRLRLDWIFIVCAVAAALGLRFWGIGSRPLWLDEAYSSWFISRGWAELWLVTPTYETHPPFYYSLLKPWSLFVGADAAGMRSLSAVAGAAAVVVVGLCARELGRNTVLLVAACALAASSPRLLVIGQDARPYALLFLSYSLAIWAWLRLTREFGEGGAGERSSWLLLGLGTLLTLWLHSLGILYAAALATALLSTGLTGATRQRVIRAAVTAALTLLLYLPCLLMIVGRAGDWSSGWLAWNGSDFPAQMITLFGFHNYSEDISPLLALLLVPGFAVLGLWSLGKTARRRVAIGLALLLLLPPLAAGLISQLVTPVFVPRIFVGVLVPAYLLAAIGLSSLTRGSALFWGGLLAGAAVANLAQAIVREPPEPWDHIAAILHRQMKPHDVVWVYPNDLALPLRSATGPAPIRSIPADYPALGVAGSRPAGSPAVVAVDGEQAQAWAARQRPAAGATIWLLTGHDRLFDPSGRVAAELERGRVKGAERRWRDLRLVPLYPPKVEPAS